MSNPDLAFDPVLPDQAGWKILDADVQQSNTVTDNRSLFYRLNQPGESSTVMPEAYDFISCWLAKTEKVCVSINTRRHDDQIVALSSAPEIEALPEALVNRDNMHQCLHQTAAVLLTQPDWLQAVCQVASSQSDIAVRMMSVYLALTGKAQDSPDLRESCKSFLRSQDIRVPDLYRFSFSQQDDILPEIVDFAGLQRALGLFPRTFFPEILGFTLAYCRMPTLFEVCFPEHPLPTVFFDLHRRRAERQVKPLQHCITDYLSLFTHHQAALIPRIIKGFHLYRVQMQRCRERMYEHLHRPLTSQQAVAELLQRKAAAAIGHHATVQLQGKSLDTWFAGLPENSLQFLDALKQSRYVNRQQPESSPILKLFAFKGPMFGVLDAAELKLLGNGLLNTDHGALVFPSHIPEETVRPVVSLQQEKTIFKSRRLNNRELYYYLINSDLFPEVRSVVHRKVYRLLQMCRFFNALPFKSYSHKQFSDYLEAVYQREINAYQPLQGKPGISRAAYIWGFEQVAPMILIDGCWLQNSLSIENNHPEIAEILFKTYGDETGNGRLQQNHPYIFQQLLNSLSIQLPPVYSKEFIHHPGFIDSAFGLPVYMMSLSLFTQEFLPELLGLNMAIELSGLGKGYMRLVDEMNYWKIDPTIARIHISIDNFASGHAYLAKQAIQIYMDDISQSSGGQQTTLDHHWRRIYTGYASLAFIGSRFKYSLPVGYLKHKFSCKLGLNGKRAHIVGQNK